MDVPALQSISGDLRWSAHRLNDSTRRVASVVQGFDSADAGACYAAQGERIVAALSAVRTRMFSWANCINDAGVVLEQVAQNHGEVDDASASGIAASQGLML